MKSAIVVIIAGVLLCAAGFCAFYYWGTASHRGLLHQEAPELAWLKKEFNLSDGELARVTQLHDTYQPHCAEMCRLIDEHGDKLKTLLTGTNTVTPEIEAMLAESAKLRVECQRDMLQHFFEVSQTMPSAQGRRYIEWISERTFIRSHDSMNTVGHSKGH
jgi:hypothetical protein